MPTLKGEPEWLKRSLDQARLEGRLREGSVPAALAGPHLTAAVTLTESKWQARVISQAHAYGWRVAHFRRVRVQRKNGATYYETPVAADGKGFPDLILVRGGRCVAAELKVGRNTTTPEQREWLAAFAVAGIESYVWRPEDQTQVEEVLA